MLGGVAKKFLESINNKKKFAAPKESLASERRAHQLLHPGGLSVPELNPNRLRVVVFRDDKGMKRPIFDSQQFTSEEGEEQCTRSLCDMRHGECLDSSLSSSSNGLMTASSGTHSAGWATQSNKIRRGMMPMRPSTDSELLGEMMFGSMPMKVFGNTVKVHYTRSTDQLMLSKVFTSQRKVLAQCSITDFADSCPLRSYSPARSVERSFSGRSNKALRHVSPDVTQPSSSTLSVPIMSLYPNSSLSSSTHSPPSPLNSLTVPSHASSLSRRIQRSRSTSLENANELYRKVLKPLDQPANGNSRNKRKYAIGFIICLSELSKTDIRHFQSFIFSHFTLIDAHLERLKIGVEEAYSCRHQGITAESFISRAYETFLRDFLHLYSAPRIESPAWLSLVSHVDRRKEVCVQFMEELASAIVELDTKETKFFLSSLLTAVLANHLAWIFTVSHEHSSSDGNRHGKYSKSLGVLAESHPYNPLWAQLGDLFGSVSNPLKMCRTVVTGQSASIVCRLLYLLTYFIRCSEVEPGLSTLEQDLTSPLPSTVPMCTPEVTIPSSTTATTGSSTDTSSYDISQLDETDVFGSRASSVTVISEHDQHSALSPFASPVNQGADTPIISIRPHPFSIRPTPLSTMSPSDYRKGSQSESDSVDSWSGRGQQEAGPNVTPRPLKKTGCTGLSGDLLTSQSGHTPLRKNSPLLSSSRQTGFASNKSPEEDSQQVADHLHQCNCHYGNPNTCAALACCESMGMCPVQDGFLTFDPSEKSVAAGSGNAGRRHDDFSISHLATRGLLGPSHSLESNASSTHTSSSSLDSGYDHSWSLTNSSRNSCAEFAGSFSMACSNKNRPSALDTPMATKCLCNEEDSGRGSQCSCPKDKGCRRVLHFADPGAKHGCCRVGKSSPAMTSQPAQGLGDNKTTGSTIACSNAPYSGVKSRNTDVAAEKLCTEEERTPAFLVDPDPMHSVFPMKLSRYSNLPPQDETVSPLLSPESPEEKQLGSSNSPLDVFAASSDPLAPLLPRKLKNHIRSIAQARASSEDVNLVSSDFVGLDNHAPVFCTLDSKLCTDADDLLESAPGQTASLPASIPSRGNKFVSNFSTSSVPALRIPTTTTSSLLCHAPTSYQPPPRVVVGDTPPSTTGSICSEADSGRGTKSSLKTDDFDTLSQISEMSYEFEPESVKGSLNTLALLRHGAGVRANSSPPLFDNQPPIKLEDEEQCSMGGVCRSYPNLFKPEGKGRRLDTSASQSKLMCEGEGPTAERPGYAETRCLSDPPSVLHQQLYQHDQSLMMGMRPSTLEQFDNFTDVPLPDLEDFLLDTPTHRHLDENATRRHQMSDFGHSLFVGLSPRYLPDFVLHGTTESADQALQDKLLKDLAHTVKHSIIDEPVEYGVGIVADTDSWTVKVMAASKSVQTSDVIYGSGVVTAAKCVKQMLSSVKNMHSLRMPAEFCLSYVEDSLQSLNDRSIMLADSLLEVGGNADFTEILPKVADSLSISPSDINLLLPVAAVNCQDPDMAGRFNHLHMQQTLGKHFI